MTEHDAELAELAGSFIHEVKNHIGTLGLNLQILAEDFAEPGSQREKRALERVQRLQKECQRLVDLSNDFLRFAHVQQLEREPSRLETVLEDLIDFFLPTANQHSVEIKVYLPSDLPRISLDQELFKQAILNLLLNAQQAMPDGGEITIQAQLEDRHGEDVVCLSLIDTGEGMAPEVSDKIFQPFYSRRRGGTGLGLPTARRIVEAHAGTIDVQSDAGRGTCFTIRLPACE